MSNEFDQHISEGRDIHNRTVETDGWKIEDGKQISSLLPFHSVHDLSLFLTLQLSVFHYGLNMSAGDFYGTSDEVTTNTKAMK